jgi:predicted transcriptional regulator
MSSVFISYSHADSMVADQISGILTELGVEYFRDVKDIDWGHAITASVHTALDDCIAILVVISPASLKSQWVPYELGHARALRKPILPYLIHPSLDVPHYIRDLNFVTSLEQVREYFTNSFPLQQAQRKPDRIDGPPLSDLAMKVLVAIGGGPIHATRIAEYLKMKTLEALSFCQMLKARGFVEMNADGNWRLTSQGEDCLLYNRTPPV